MRLSGIKPLRATLLPLLSRINLGDITIRHHYTGDPVRLHSYRHKGYWYHGKKREMDTMEMFQRVLRKGDTVLEVGAHIGYISLFFKKLIGNGKLIVFEPGENNLPYLTRNVEGKEIEVVRKAIGKQEGVCSFFLDNLSGQNNSLLQDFFKREKTEAEAFDAKAKGVRETKVEVITLDRFVAERGLKPALVKIDIEGAEYDALLGMKRMLVEHRPIVMVEVQTNHREVEKFFTELNCALLDSTGRPFPIGRNGNIFCFHREEHRQFLPHGGA